jgi:hypothetical protein
MSRPKIGLHKKKSKLITGQDMLLKQSLFHKNILFLFPHFNQNIEHY